MLTLLHIENIAVVESADISFDRGFNVLSGETGAGKSIIIDAISAILGERAYREVIRTGTDKAFVSAVFDGVPELPWFGAMHVPYEGQLMIQREIFLDGRNLCRVNGQAVSVGALKALGVSLVSIHGQHDSQQLFDEAKHLELLDAFAEDEALLTDYREAYDKAAAIAAQLKRLNLDESEKLRRMESLQHQIAELEKAGLRPGEDQELEARQKLLLNAEKLTGGLQGAVSALFGDDEKDGACDQINRALRQLSSVARLDQRASGLLEKLQELGYGLTDTAEELRDYSDSFSSSEEELDEIGARLDLLHRLKRKYGGSCEEMIAYLAKAKEELDDIAFSDEKKEQLQKQLNEAAAVMKQRGALLTQARQEAAGRLGERILTELAELNMPRVQFQVAFTPTHYSPTGAESAAFLMSANVGEAMKPLSKVASGGELARIMLALKNVLAQQDAVGTMIFDEVDAGVSGRAAQKVAEKLRSVARGRQVLCVTHLPQIAALAEHHLLISKSVREERTYTQVRALDRQGRVDELARMIGGAQITENTRKSAEEMLA
ncbi:MAG: DNA repair protein RecN [Oscillospiraceae bacterium]|nr:DNA repair protein RecN [Oscillospiraceae bacterium]